MRGPHKTHRDRRRLDAPDDHNDRAMFVGDVQRCMAGDELGLERLRRIRLVVEKSLRGRFAVGETCKVDLRGGAYDISLDRHAVMRIVRPAIITPKFCTSIATLSVSPTSGFGIWPFGNR